MIRSPGVITAIDPATACGFAQAEMAEGPWKYLQGGVTILGKEPEGQRFRDLQVALDIWASQSIYAPSAIYYEAPLPGVRKGKDSRPYASKAWRWHLGYEAIILAWARDRRIHCTGVRPDQIKKWATGNSRATKRDMIFTASVLLHNRPSSSGLDENHADALHLLDYGIHHYTGGRQRLSFTREGTKC